MTLINMIFKLCKTAVIFKYGGQINIILDNAYYFEVYLGVVNNLELIDNWVDLSPSCSYHVVISHNTRR